MKRREKYKITNYAIAEYSKIFEQDYKRANISKRKIRAMLKEYSHSCMAIWYYCCKGLYWNCWQDPFEEGIWNMSQKQVDKCIWDIVCELPKCCLSRKRAAIYVDNRGINLLIVARDLPGHKCDYLITFTNIEE